MMIKARNISTRFRFLALSAGCALLLSTTALAAPPTSPPTTGQLIEGCDQKVLKAAQAKARARVVYDYATTEESVDKPDSQLAMTCFNNIAGVAQSGTDGGGSIFSGDLDGHWWDTGITYPYTNTNPPVWTTDTYYSDLIEDGLNAFYNEFQDADGNDAGTVDYTATATALADTPDCKEEQDLWGDPGAPTPGPGDIRGEGVQGGVPFVIDENLRGTIPPNNTDPKIGVDYNQELNLDMADLTAYDTAMNALAPANIKPVTPSFSANNTSCNVLLTAGVTATCP